MAALTRVVWRYAVAATFLSQWEALKKGLDAEIKRAPPPSAPLDKLLSAVQKSTGFTPVLKDVDEALKKRFRKPAVKALKKFYGLREPYNAVPGAPMREPDIDMTLMTALNEFSHDLKALEVDIVKEIKALQEEKGGDEARPNLMLLFEVDLRKNIEKTKQALKPLAAIDRKHDVLTLVEPAATRCKGRQGSTAG